MNRYLHLQLSIGPFASRGDGCLRLASSDKPEINSATGVDNLIPGCRVRRLDPVAGLAEDYIPGIPCHLLITGKCLDNLPGNRGAVALVWGKDDNTFLGFNL